MATLLLIIICIAFIGLGIPDSLFGTVWPAIYPEFGVPVSYAPFVTCMVSCGTVLSSLLSTRVISRFGTEKVTFVSTLMTAAAMLGFSFSGNLWWMMLFAVPLGLGAGSVDTGLNNYVAVHYKASHMSYLHCFYGVGVTISPWIMSMALKNTGWREGYHILFGIQLAIALLIFVTLPLWKKVAEKQPEEEPMEVLSLAQVLKIRGVPFSLLVYLGSCGIEAIILGYATTYLTQSHGVTPATAAEIITFYYIGMTLGRFLSGVISKKFLSEQIILMGEALTAAAVLLLLFAPSAFVAGLSLFLVGLGNGPVFPNMTHLAPIHYGKTKSQAFIGVQGAVAYVAFMVLPVLTGILIRRVSADIFPWILVAAVALTALSTLTTLRIHSDKLPKEK